MRPPHVLLASSNVSKLRTNVAHLLDEAHQKLLVAAIDQCIVDQFRFGLYHLEFARALPPAHWRQSVSRLYYGAYNVSRAVRLCDAGIYSTESEDHKKIATLPKGFPSQATYAVQLPLLRDDRNMCDYDYSIETTDLIIPPDEARTLVETFVVDSRQWFLTKGITL